MHASLSTLHRVCGTFMLSGQRSSSRAGAADEHYTEAMPSRDADVGYPMPAEQDKSQNEAQTGRRKVQENKQASQAAVGGST